MQSNDLNNDPRYTAESRSDVPAFRGIWTVALAIALAAVFASTLPQVFFVAVFGELLFFGALGMLAVAALRRDKVWSRSMTGWDQAALLALLSGLIGLFVDVEAIALALEEQAAIPR